MPSERSYKRALVWFRRDLRVEDNTALFHAAREAREVVPLFILDETILRSLPKQDSRLRFLAETLQRLDYELQSQGASLVVLHGNPREIIPKLLRRQTIEALYVARPHSAATMQMDAEIARFCGEHAVAMHTFEDTLLVSPEAILPKKVFTPFYKHWSSAEKQAPLPGIPKRPGAKVRNEPLRAILDRYHPDANLWAPDGWKRRLKLFDVCRYLDTRNLPAIDGTSRLSPYLRFGLISIRQLYARMCREATPSCVAETFISELAWREFWHHIMHHFPETRTLEFQEKRRGLPWRYDDKLFDAWREGRTGYPIVDAGMRQLRQEGWMHGRARMIVASFLTKDMLMDWRLGEKHFADYLYDYDENVNIGNWQWSASVGADPRPLRIFSPILQSQRFDPDAIYIKRYVPELKTEAPARIHDPLKYKLSYHEPVVDHREMSRRARLFYAT